MPGSSVYNLHTFRPQCHNHPLGILENEEKWKKKEEKRRKKGGKMEEKIEKIEEKLKKTGGKKEENRGNKGKNREPYPSPFFPFQCFI